MENFESLLKRIYKKYKDHKYHQYYKRTAFKYLNSIEQLKVPTNPKFTKLSDEYAQDVLGWKGYAPWLYLYSAVQGTFKEGWIPDNYFGHVVVPSIKGEYGKTANLKALSCRLFEPDFFPDIGYYINGCWFSKDYEILNEKMVKDYLFSKWEKIVFKVDDSYQGMGIYFFNKNTFNQNQIKKLGNGVFQHYIDQHSFFHEFMPNSVATLRLTSVIDNNGKASVRAGHLKFGRTHDTHINSTSRMRVPVNIADGMLGNYGYLHDWKTVAKHPDTNIAFANKKIPNFNKSISTIEKLHSQLPIVLCIGWDLVIDKNNEVKIMEWNGKHNDIKFSEAIYGPCFEDLGWEKLWKEKK